MPTYYDSQNQPYILTNSLGRGGEGTVYAIDENPQIVAKIYHERISFEKIQKLRWMAANHDEQLLKFAAWVIDVLTDSPNGKVVGFLMPSVRAKEIHELYSLKSRRVYFPDATWHFLIHTATNLARAFHSLHKKDHVIGDVNHGNCVVLADGTVKLIDCDSYSIKTDNKRYPCEVGVATHLPPELQGVKLRDVERQLKHDNFGLAVIIFQLLFLGRHPFAGNFLGGEDKSIEDAIRGHLFAYGKDAKMKMIAQPPGSLSLSAVSPRVANLFERAFTKDFIRPEPRDWIEALEDLADNLEQCVLHPGHLYYEKNLVCPWCEIESQTGLTVFPFIVNDNRLSAKYKKTFDVATVENLISSFNIKPNFTVRLNEDLNLKSLPPTAEIVKEKTAIRNKNLLSCALYAGFFLIFYLILPTTACVFVFSIFAAIILYSIHKGNSFSSTYVLECEELTNKQSEWDQVENEWAKFSIESDLAKNLNLVREKLDVYQKINNSDAQVERLLTKADTPAESNEIEHEISSLLISLRSGSARLRAKQQQLVNKSKKLTQELSQLDSNIRYLNNTFPIGIFLFTAAIFLPFITLIINPLIPYESPKTEIQTMPPPKATKKSSYPTPIPTPIMGDPNVEIPDFKITDKEISELTFAKRNAIVNKLMDLADENQNKKDYKNAEANLKFALRFDNTNVRLLNAIGIFYYYEGKFQKSLEYYEISKDLNDNDDINFLIGLNYLGLKKYSDARDIFSKLINDNNETSENFFNLGQAYFGLKNYPDAANAYRQSLEINSSDIETIYQLGITFNKLGDKDGVKEMYKKLVERNTYKTEEFKKAIGKSVNLDMPPDIIRSKPATVVETEVAPLEVKRN